MSRHKLRICHVCDIECLGKRVSCNTDSATVGNPKKKHIAMRRPYHVLLSALPTVPKPPGSVSTAKGNHSCIGGRCRYAVDCFVAIVYVSIDKRLSIPPSDLPDLNKFRTCSIALSSCPAKASQTAQLLR